MKIFDTIFCHVLTFSFVRNLSIVFREVVLLSKNEREGLFFLKQMSLKTGQQH